MTDSCLNAKMTYDAPAAEAESITPADTDFPVEYRALYVGVAGNVVVRPFNSVADVTFTGVPAGTILPIRVRRVASATTAAAIVGLR